jgi:hypothetical protein
MNLSAFQCLRERNGVVAAGIVDHDDLIDPLVSEYLLVRLP